MPAIPTILLALLAGAGAPRDDRARADRADYQAAFDDAADYAPGDAWAQNRPGQPPAEAESRGASPARPVRLPLQFRSAESVHVDPAVRPAAGVEPDGPARQASAERVLPLAPPSDALSKTAERLPTASIPTVAGSLIGVVGLFLVVAWIMRRGLPKGSGLLPREVVEVLGRTTFAGRQQLHLLRLGNKLVLVSVSPSGVESVAEVTDPVEVDRLTGLCYQSHPHSASTSFRQVFQNFEDPRGGYATGRQVDRLDLSQLDGLASGTPGRESRRDR